MTLKQKILKSPFAVSVGAWIMSLYIRFVFATTRWERRNFEVIDQIKGKPVFVCFWHGRLMMIPLMAPKSMKWNSLNSNHKDGVLIEKIINHLGVNSIKGSSNNGGIPAVKEIIKKIKAGESVAITPDGPRGPARKVGGNLVKLAKKLDIQIIPVTFSTNKHKIAKSWDNFMVVKPFGKGVFILGNPVSPETDGELERIMNELTDEADLAAKSL